MYQNMKMYLGFSVRRLLVSKCEPKFDVTDKKDSLLGNTNSSSLEFGFYATW
jgi:hypothetical protein